MRYEKKEIKTSDSLLDKEDEHEINLMLHRYKMGYRFRTGKYPDEKLIEKQRKKIMKKFISQDKEKMHQVEKEDGQMKCLLDIMRRENKHLSIEEMSELLIKSGFTVGSSIKTIYRRILPELIDRGALKDENNKYYIPEYKRNPEFEKRAAEDMTNRMETVSIISNFLEILKDSPVYEKAKKYIDEEFRLCNRRRHHEGINDFDENSLVSRVIFLGAPVANVKSGFWDIIHSAMQENNYINISYIAEDKKKPSKYTVQPYQLIYDNGFWELWGNCTTANHRGTKLFNLSRIQKVEIVEKSNGFKLPNNYDFRYTLAGNFGCYNDEIAEDYSIKFKKDSYAYLYVKDRVWGEFQEIKEVDDGYILEFEATQYKPILRWVLSFGSEVQPLEPQKLVSDWKEQIRNMTKML